MSDDTQARVDRFRDEALASIRKKISDNELLAKGIGAHGVSPSARADVVAAIAPPSGRDEDVLLLTDFVDEAGSEDRRSTSGARPAERPGSRVASVDGALVEGKAASLASSAFDRLNQAVQDSVPAPAAEDSGPLIHANGKTIEDLVKDLMRPMLKDWLDKNLPTMVERYVEREIDRLTRR